MSKHDEIIGFVSREILEAKELLAHGFSPKRMLEGEDELAILLANLDYAKRGPLEEDPSRKQLIPYVVVTRGEHVFTMRRKRASREARLHDKGSIGVGGHLSAEDGASRRASAFDEITAGMMRELGEELALSSRPATHEIFYRGLINDDTNEVGQVHLGIVYHLSIAESVEVSVRETEKLEGSWSKLDELARVASEDKLETWSALLLEPLRTWLDA